MSWEKVASRLAERDIKTERGLSLKTLSSFRVGGVCPLSVLPDSVDALTLSVRLLREEGIPFRVVGNGSNLLFGDGTLSGALILTKGVCSIKQEENRLTADCGVTLASLARFAASRSLSGLEFAAGIPGTVGGALYMNAGAYGGEMSHVVLRSIALNTETGEVLEITVHDFGYRTGIYKKNPSLLCLRAELSLVEGDREAILETMQSLAVARREKQPLEYPSAGSYFKRPEGHFAGKLIEDCGLKGLRVGGAEVSLKHAGFVINRGAATAEDVLSLEETVRERVFERFGVTLEREVEWIPTDREEKNKG